MLSFKLDIYSKFIGNSVNVVKKVYYNENNK